jgi:NAD(P)H-dependent FMN reductase
VTPEYNQGVLGPFKKALEFLYAEWHQMAVGFVSYGGWGGLRSMEYLRLTAIVLHMAPVSQQLLLSLRTDF